jgi:hypothetical protein
MALALGWLEIAGYGGRKARSKKAFLETRHVGWGRGGGEGKVYAITPPATTKK